MSESCANKVELRVRRSYLVTGVLCAIAFAAIGTWSVFAAALNIDGSFPQPIQMAVLFGVFWGALFAVALYIIAASFREKVIMTSQSITHKCVFRTCTTAISEIKSVKWRAWPIHGSIVIRYASSRITLHLDNFHTGERELLIGRLRKLVPEDCQENWDAFVNARQPERRHTRNTRSTAIVCMALFLIVAAVCAYLWSAQFGFKFLAATVGCGLVGLWYFFRILNFDPDPASE